MDGKTLAQKLGLSLATVSRVLNGSADRYRIAKATQERVLEAARRSNVNINLAARSLRLGISHTIGLVVPDISNPFFATLGRSIERSARAKGYSVLLADSQESEEVEMESFALMRGRNVDGMIVAPVSGRETSSGLFSKWGKPLVVVDRAPAQLHPVSVVLDNREAARQGVRLLADAGHRAIACIRGDFSSYSDQERFRGYRAAQKELGLDPHPSWAVGGAYSIECGQTSAQALLACVKRPTAVLAFGNLLALGALDTFRQNGISIPTEISIISFDEQPWAASMAPPLTTIAQPVQQMGEAAVGLLLESLVRKSKRQEPQRMVLPFSIIKRSSIEPPRPRA